MAAGNNATLQVEVVSKGIADTVKKLDSLGNAAARNEAKVTKLTDSLNKLMLAQDSAVNKAVQHSNLMSAIAQSMAQVSTYANNTAKSVQSLNASLNALTTAAQSSNKALDEKAKKAGVVVTTVRAMAAAFSVYTGINLAKSIVEGADAWAMMTARMTVATGSLNNAKVAQEEMFELSQKLRVPLEETGRLYTRLAPAMRNLGKSSKETREMVEGVATALQLSGATGAETASVMLQFSQAMQAGRLNGAEFNAVAEGAPKILEALEKQTGKNRGELKKMGSEGKLSVELIQEAMQKALPQWREDFAKLPITVDSAMTRIKNAWMKAMGELNENSGFSTGIVNTLKVIEEIIPKVRDEMVAAFIAVGAWIGKNKTALGEIWDQAKGLVKDLWGIGSAIGFAIGQVVGLGNEFSVFGFALFSARVVLAGIQDGLVLIGAAILKLSYPLMKGLVEPLAFVATSLLQIIVEAVDRITYGLGKAAKFAGFEELGDGLLGVSDFMESVSDKMEDAKKGIFGMAQSMSKAGDEALAYLASGDSAVQRVLKGEEEVTQAIKERLKYQENANPNPKKTGDADGDKATAKAQENARDELKKTVAAYGELIAAKEQLEKYGLDGDKRTAMQKAQLELETKLALATSAKEKAMLQQALNITIFAQTVEKDIALKKEQLELEDKHRKTMEQKIKAATDEAIATEYKVQAYGMAKGAIEALELAAEEEVLRTLRQNYATEEAIALQERLIEAKVRGGEAASALGAKESETKAIEDIDKLLDPSKALAFGDALSEAFGKAGSAVGKLTKAFDEMNGRQKLMTKAREKLFDIKDPKKYQERLTALSHKEAKDRINSYGDMAGAAKGFFKEGSKGYKAMEAAEKTFRAFEMAMALEAYIRKTFFAQAEAQAFAQAELQKAIAADEGAASIIQAAVAEGQASATAGVAAQAQGDPYTAWARMAMMAATMAALGFAVGGGGGSAPKLSEQRQKVQGTGTVLGAEDEKSKSISNSLELLKENSDLALRHSSGMLAALQNIRDGISGMARFVAQSSGLRGTRADELALGVGESSGRGAFGSGFMASKTKIELMDSGIIFAGGQTVGSMVNDGVSAQSYADMRKTKKKWYGKTKTSNWTEYGELQDALLEQIGLTVNDLTDGIVAASSALGANGEMIREQLMNFGVDIGRISLQGLSGDEIADELEAVFGMLGDEMAHSVFTGVEDFQKVGEGYFETLVRVANGVEVAKYELDRLGVTMIEYSDVINKNGDVAAELVRDSLSIREVGSSIQVLINEMQGSAQDIVGVYKQLVDVRNNMKFGGMGDNLTREFLYGAGGLDNLQDAMNSFIDGYYSDAEKQAMASAKVVAEFNRIGITNVPRTRQEFRELVTTLVAGGEATQAMAGMVISLSDAFNEAQELAEDYVSTARDNLTEAYERERDALEETKEKFEDFAKSLREFRDSLLTGGMSPLTNSQKYAEMAAQYNDIVNKARTGDEDAIAKFQSVANEFLQISREYNASGDAYIADFNSVVTEAAYLASVSEHQADLATQSLEALNKQVEGLMELNTSVLTVTQAVEELHAAMAAAGMALPLVDGSHANGLSYVPFDGYTAELHEGEAVLTAAENQAYQSGRSSGALVDEIKALKAEVSKLREEQADQTNRVIGANYDANERNAERVVEGTVEAADKAAWKGNTSINLV